MSHEGNQADASGGVALITGAASGIGRAIAERVAADGRPVAVADIDQAGLDETAAAIESAGGTAVAVVADVTSLEEMRSAVAEAESGIGRVTALVNSAGWERRSLFLDSDPADWDRIVAVNLLGTMNAARAVLERMIEVEVEDGRIVCISSDAGRVGSSQESVYSGAKAGVIGFGKGIAREMARHQIKVNVVCPGPTDTPMLAEAADQNPKLNDALTRAVPLRRVARPEEIAAAVSFLLSEDSAYITGQTLSVSGGLTMS